MTVDPILRMLSAVGDRRRNGDKTLKTGVEAFTAAVIELLRASPARK